MKKDEDKSKDQFISELSELRSRIAELEASETEHKRMEEALTQEQHLLNFFMDNIPDRIYFKDTKSRFIRINKALANHFGLSGPAQAVGKTDFDFFTEEHAQQAYTDEQEVIRSGKSLVGIEEKETWPAGQETWVSTTKMPLRDLRGQIIGTFGISRDITECKRTEESLRKSEEKYQSLYDNAPDIYFTVSPDAVVTSVNRSGAEYLGYSKEELLGSPRWTFVHKDDLKIVQNQVAQIFNQKLMHSELEFRKVRRDGSIIWVHERTSLILGENGAPAELRMICRDISDRRQANELKRYKELFDNVADGVFILNLKGRFVEANEGFSEKTGYTREELSNLNIKDLVQPEQIPFIANILGKIREKKSAQFDLGIKTKVGGIILEEVNSQFTSYQDKECFLCVARDITKEKLLQDQLIRSERLAATGQLAASIAHEINSPLQGITSLLNVMKKTHTQDEELLNEIDLVKDAYGSIRNTVRKLLDLNRPGKERKRTINVNNVILDTLTLVRGLLKKRKIEANLSLSRRVPYITASSQQMGQVFMNLINNSVEAITGKSQPGGGRNRRSPQSLSGLSGEQISISTHLRKGSIVIEISDTGPGIPEEDLQRIFDPFYTQKKTMGIGVGLPICNGIIEDHKGAITAKNLEDRGGACIVITLPVEQI